MHNLHIDTIHKLDGFRDSRVSRRNPVEKLTCKATINKNEEKKCTRNYSICPTWILSIQQLNADWYFIEMSYDLIAFSNEIFTVSRWRFYFYCLVRFFFFRWNWTNQSHIRNVFYVWGYVKKQERNEEISICTWCKIRHAKQSSFFQFFVFFRWQSLLKRIVFCTVTQIRLIFPLPNVNTIFTFHVQGEVNNYST